MILRKSGRVRWCSKKKKNNTRKKKKDTVKSLVSTYYTIRLIFSVNIFQERPDDKIPHNIHILTTGFFQGELLKPRFLLLFLLCFRLFFHEYVVVLMIVFFSFLFPTIVNCARLDGMNLTMHQFYRSQFNFENHLIQRVFIPTPVKVYLSQRKKKHTQRDHNCL